MVAANRERLACAVNNETMDGGARKTSPHKQAANRERFSCAVNNDTMDGGARQMSPRKKAAQYFKRKHLGRRSSNESQGQDSCSTATTAASSIATVKAVSFNLKVNVVHKLEPLWESPAEKKACFIDKEELLASRQHARYLLSSDDSGKTYINAFDQTYKQVHTEVDVNENNFHELVQGSKLGLRGLEQNYGRSSRRRKTMVHQHVLAILKLHHDEKFGSEVKVLPQCHSKEATPHWQRNATGVDTAEALRELSTKLSACNRRYAVLLGKVDFLAVDDQDVEDCSFAFSSHC